MKFCCSKFSRCCGRWVMMRMIGWLKEVMGSMKKRKRKIVREV